ncbi:MAG: tetratricopeptide repeat protein [Phycisphaerae bacterium]|nr:tetratricopeptide repeat protein [Phycisphaerae bacterium]
MAKKRLNKKVALIGFIVIILFAIGGIAVFLRLSQDPEKFIQDGDAAFNTEDYEKAAENYLRAKARTKSDELKVDILFKLSETYLKTGGWKFVVGCWSNITQIEPNNVKAQLGLIKYLYILADSGASAYWKQIDEQIGKFIEIADAEVLGYDVADWQPFEIESICKSKKIGSTLYFVKGRAIFEMAQSGSMSNIEQGFDDAIENLQKSLDLDPANTEAHYYIARAAAHKGDVLENRGVLGAHKEGMEKAKQTLEKLLQAAPNDPQVHINYLTMLPAIKEIKTQDEYLELEPLYQEMITKFPTSAEVYSAAAGFYSQLGPKYLQKMIEFSDKAKSLETENILYAIQAANCYYMRYSLENNVSDLTTAMTIVKDALELPGAQEGTGPKQWEKKNYRVSLYALLANSSLEQLIYHSERFTEDAKQQMLDDAQAAVHQIEQLVGSGEDLRIVKWRALYELAQGNTNEAGRSLYDVYQKTKAQGAGDPQAAYALAHIFKNSTETGALTEFLAVSISGGMERFNPEIRLDYAQVLIKLNYGTPTIIANIKAYEDVWGATSRSSQLAAAAYIRAKQFDDAEEQIKKLDKNDLNRIQWNFAIVREKINQVQMAAGQDSNTPNEAISKELSIYRRELFDLGKKMLSSQSDIMDDQFMVTMVNNYIAENDIESAKAFIGDYIKVNSESTAAIFYQKLLNEADPQNVPVARRQELEKLIISQLTDPAKRAIALSQYDLSNNDPNSAFEQLASVVDMDSSDELSNEQRQAISTLFDVSLGTKKWDMAEKIVTYAQKQNIDQCQGLYFKAMLVSAKDDLKQALVFVNEVLTSRPVFSYGYLLRSQIYSRIGNELSAVEDAQKAAMFNPLDAQIAKNQAIILLERNRKLGDNVTVDQISEVQRSLMRAILFNQSDIGLQSIYAEYISATQPENALSMRQKLFETYPSPENAVMLARMATNMAATERNQEKKQALLDIAESSLEQAKQMAPNNTMVLSVYAEFLRMTGENEKAEQMIKQAKDDQLLWKYYIQVGKLDEAKTILEEMNRNDKTNVDVLKGLVLIAQRSGDNEMLKKYSDELVNAEPKQVDLRILQVQNYLNAGLLKEAEEKLGALRERFPDEERSLILEAWWAMKKGDLPDALELANKYLQNNQDSDIAWRLRGQINFLMARYDQAVFDLKKSITITDDSATRIMLAKAYFRIGRDIDAISELKFTVEKVQVPDESVILLEQIYNRSNRISDLERLYADLMVKFPDNVVWQTRAAALAIRTDDIDKGERMYESIWQQIEDQKLNYPPAFDGYLDAMILNRKYEKVFALATDYIDSPLAPIAFYRIGEAKSKMGDSDGAWQYYTKALEKADLNENFIFRLLSEMVEKFGDVKVGQYCVQRAQAEKESVAANLTLYVFNNINSDYNKAIENLDACLKLLDSQNPLVIDYSMKKAGMLQQVYEKTSDKSYLQKAVNLYESMLEKMPNNPAILNNFAYTLAQYEQRIDEALECIKKAHNAVPDNALLLDTYGYVLMKNGMFDEAEKNLLASLQQFEAAKQNVPFDVYEHLGMVREKMGKTSEAKMGYELALETGGDELPQAAKKRIEEAIKRVEK